MIVNITKTVLKKNTRLTLWHLERNGSVYGLSVKSKSILTFMTSSTDTIYPFSSEPSAQARRVIHGVNPGGLFFWVPGIVCASQMIIDYDTPSVCWTQKGESGHIEAFETRKPGNGKAVVGGKSTTGKAIAKVHVSRLYL